MDILKSSQTTTTVAHDLECSAQGHSIKSDSYMGSEEPHFIPHMKTEISHRSI